MTSSNPAPWCWRSRGWFSAELMGSPREMPPSEGWDRRRFRRPVHNPDVGRSSQPPACGGPSARSAVRTLHASRLARGLPLGRNDPLGLAQVALECVIPDLIEQDADPPAGADIPW